MSEVDQMNEVQEVEVKESPEAKETQESVASEIESQQDAVSDASDEEKDILDLPLPGEETEEVHKEEKKLPKWAEKRISKKERELAQKAAEAEAYRQELERVKQAQASPQNGFVSQARTDAPQRENFESDHDYIEAVIDYKTQRTAQQQQIEQQRKALEQAELSFHNRLKQTIDSGEEKYEDFEDKIEVLFRPQFPSNRAMAEAIVDSSFSRDILYFLGTYPSEAKKIAEMNPIQAVKKIAEIEQRFAAKKKSAVTKAPPVISPVSGGKGSAVISNKDPENMQDFREWYKAKYGK